MTRYETPVGDVTDESTGRVTDLELLTDDEHVWTAVPRTATGDERVTRWISVDVDVLCDLEVWR